MPMATYSPVRGAGLTSPVKPQIKLMSERFSLASSFVFVLRMMLLRLTVLPGLLSYNRPNDRPVVKGLVPVPHRFGLDDVIFVGSAFYS